MPATGFLKKPKWIDDSGCITAYSEFGAEGNVISGLPTILPEPARPHFYGWRIADILVPAQRRDEDQIVSLSWGVTKSYGVLQAREAYDITRQ